MRRVFFLLGLAGTLALAGCGGGGPKAGETVTPVLDGPSSWTAGEEEELAVRLRADGPEGKRNLGFGGIPSSSNPRATVTFFDGETALAPVEVSLSHRC
jgi:hypothetical protein